MSSPPPPSSSSSFTNLLLTGNNNNSSNSRDMDTIGWGLYGTDHHLNNNRPATGAGGLEIPKFKSFPPPSLPLSPPPLSPSSYFAFPPGLTASDLLDSPVLFSSAANVSFLLPSSGFNKPTHTQCLNRLTEFWVLFVFVFSCCLCFFPKAASSISDHRSFRRPEYIQLEERLFRQREQSAAAAAEGERGNPFRFLLPAPNQAQFFLFIVIHLPVFLRSRLRGFNQEATTTTTTTGRLEL
ncbi:unnamed protein product [Linum tenue]|uniref:Uncharacterized protein n=1 Tax=Linum tenue TaxID=586396 RepID=A0AAV0KRU4_9ROSI|nr:unnamed protein product [Linum tenue]